MVGCDAVVIRNASERFVDAFVASIVTERIALFGLDTGTGN